MAGSGLPRRWPCLYAEAQHRAWPGKGIVESDSAQIHRLPQLKTRGVFWVPNGNRAKNAVGGMRKQLDSQISRVR
jgi:hypothetical protein